MKLPQLRVPHLPEDWAHRFVAVLPVLVPVLLMLGVMVRYADRPDFPNHEVPEGFQPSPAPTTLPPGFERPSLPVVGGSTSTTLPPNVGRARLSGFVVAPDGTGAPGVIVRLERAFGDAFQVLDVVTDGTGRYDAAGIGGGRYRVRAFLAPTLAQREAEVFFLNDGEERALDLEVDSFDQPSIRVATAPDPLLLDQPLNLVVSVTGRFVDENGFVRVQPLVGGTVTVAASGAWTRETPAGPLFTAVDGTVTVRFVCRAVAPTVVQVTVQATPESVPTTAQFERSACVDPATLTTTTTGPPSTTSTTTGSSTTTTAPSTTTTAG